MLTPEEVRQHKSPSSCWVIIHDNVYDVTGFLSQHPGGPAVIRRYAGFDATTAFDAVHSVSVIAESLGPEHNLGPVDPRGPPTSAFPEPVTTTGEIRPKKFRLQAVLNLQDFERAAEVNLPREAFAFFRAGADDEKTLQWNLSSWQNVRFRPRVLRPIRSIDMSTSIIGSKFALPFFICPAGGGKLAHAQGEVLMTKAAAKQGALHWVCNMAGCSQQEVANIRAPNQTLFWQIYAMQDLAKTEREIRQAVALGYKGFALTVDAIKAGKRERDMRVGVEELEDIEEADEEAGRDSSSGGISAIRAPVYSGFDWKDAVAWMRTMTDLPVAIKGIQCWEDAAICRQFGVHPWLSNHGGRQLEGAPSALETLLEIRQHCPEVLTECDVIVDGGIRRGTDVVKALALGAKAVGLGRPFLYALSFGEAGVTRAFNVLKSEIETAMALLGVEDVKQLGPQHVVLGQSFGPAASKARL